MLHASTARSNGTNGTHANGCTTPTPAWQSQFPKFTHNISFVDGDGCQHSLTLRSDNLKDLFGDLRMVKAMVRASKEKSRAAQSHDAGDTQPADTQHCVIHHTDMPRRWSKRTNGHYFAHPLPDGSFCYGRAKALKK